MIEIIDENGVKKMKSKKIKIKKDNVKFLNKIKLLKTFVKKKNNNDI